MVFKFLSTVPVLKALTGGESRESATKLFDKTVEQARNPHFYAEWDVPDTVEGRYDMITLHMVLVLRRLGDEREATQGFAQTLFNVMFKNMDQSLRELGVGDLKVAKKVRELAEMFYGRAGVYEVGIFDQDVPALASALSRNVWSEEAAPYAPDLARYTIAAAATLSAQPISALISGEVRFPEPAESAIS